MGGAPDGSENTSAWFKPLVRGRHPSVGGAKCTRSGCFLWRALCCSHWPLVQRVLFPTNTSLVPLALARMCHRPSTPSAVVAVAAGSVVDTEDTAAWLAGIAVGMPIAVGGRWRFVAIVAMAIAMAGERSPLEVLRIMEAGVTMARIPTMEAHVRNTILMAGGHIEALTTEVLGSIGAVATTEALGCPITGAVTEALGFPTIGVVSEAAGVGAETASDPNFENREHEACASRLKRSTLLGKSCFNGALAERSRAIPGCGQLCSFLVVPFLGIPARLL